VCRLKLIPAALALYNKKHFLNNITIDHLHLNMYLHGHVYLPGLHNMDPRVELTKLVELLKNIKIKVLTINLSHESFYNNGLVLDYRSLLVYIQQLQYLRTYIQKYCNYMQVEIYFSGDYYHNFWKNADCTYSHSKNFIIIWGRRYKNEHTYWGMIDKTRSNFHRNFKLKKRQLK